MLFVLTFLQHFISLFLLLLFYYYYYKLKFVNNLLSPQSQNYVFFHNPAIFMVHSLIKAGVYRGANMFNLLFKFLLFYMSEIRYSTDGWKHGACLANLRSYVRRFLLAVKGKITAATDWLCFHQICHFCDFQHLPNRREMFFLIQCVLMYLFIFRFRFFWSLIPKEILFTVTDNEMGHF